MEEEMWGSNQKAKAGFILAHSERLGCKRDGALSNF